MSPDENREEHTEMTPEQMAETFSVALAAQARKGLVALFMLVVMTTGGIGGTTWLDYRSDQSYAAQSKKSDEAHAEQLQAMNSQIIQWSVILPDLVESVNALATKVEGMSVVVTEHQMDYAHAGASRDLEDVKARLLRLENEVFFKVP